VCRSSFIDRRRVRRIPQALHESKALKHGHCRDRTSSIGADRGDDGIWIYGLADSFVIVNIVKIASRRSSTSSTPTMASRGWLYKTQDRVFPSNLSLHIDYPIKSIIYFTLDLIFCVFFLVFMLCRMNCAEINTIGNLGDWLHHAVARDTRSDLPSSSGSSRPMSSSKIWPGRFFYKYGPLSNAFVKTNPLRILLSNLAWRKAEKVPRVTSRHNTWRIKVSANQTGGRNIPLLALA
jgi:hypothetical protein